MWCASRDADVRWKAKKSTRGWSIGLAERARTGRRQDRGRFGRLELARLGFKSDLRRLFFLFSFLPFLCAAGGEELRGGGWLGRWVGLAIGEGGKLVEAEKVAASGEDKRRDRNWSW